MRPDRTVCFGHEFCCACSAVVVERAAPCLSGRARERDEKEREKEIVYRLMSCSSADPVSELQVHVISSMIPFTYSPPFTLFCRMPFPVSLPDYLIPSRLFCFTRSPISRLDCVYHREQGGGFRGTATKFVSSGHRWRSDMLRGTGIRSALQFNSSGCVMDDRQPVTSA